MRVALYARVSTARQAQAQTIEQQLIRLQAHARQQGWTVDAPQIYRDDGYSGARLARPGLDRLRDHAARAEFDTVLITAPDRLARNYVHQVLLVEECAQHGCAVQFLERPLNADPHDQLLLQIRGAVAEYERTLITERMRRGRLMKLQAGQLLPWSRPPFGYRQDPHCPRDPAGLQPDPVAAPVVVQLFDWYLEPQATLCQVVRRLNETGLISPTGKEQWNLASVRSLLRNRAYAGTAVANRLQVVPAQRRRAALGPAGRRPSQVERPPEEWIRIGVPALVSPEVFERVQEKLTRNRQQSARNNTRHDYLLRGLVSCGACRRARTACSRPPHYHYYVCLGKRAAARAPDEPRCEARTVPAGLLDRQVWEDLCAVLTDAACLATALERAQSGAWLPQELQARQERLRAALGEIARQEERLLDAYLAGVLELGEYQGKREELGRRREGLQAQQRQLTAQAKQQRDVAAVATGMAAFCTQVNSSLQDASFAQRRALVELLIDRVIVTDGEVEIRYVIPTSPEGPHTRFCHLRLNHLSAVSRSGSDTPAGWAPPAAAGKGGPG